MTEDKEGTAPKGSAGPSIVRSSSDTMEKTDDTPGTPQTPSDHPATSAFGQYSVCNTHEKTASAIAVIIAE